MSDDKSIDESEAKGNAFALWKPRDKYFTQPKEIRSQSKLDKTYAELTQTRGATEGAIQSKVSRWEDWDKFSKEEDKTKINSAVESKGKSNQTIQSSKALSPLDTSPSVTKTTSDRSKLESRRKSRKDERKRLVAATVTETVRSPPEVNISQSSDQQPQTRSAGNFKRVQSAGRSSSSINRDSDLSARRLRARNSKEVIVEMKSPTRSVSAKETPSITTESQEDRKPILKKKLTRERERERERPKEENNKKLEERRKRIADIKQKLRNREKRDEKPTTAAEVDKEKLVNLTQNWRKNKEQKNSKELLPEVKFTNETVNSPTQPQPQKPQQQKPVPETFSLKSSITLPSEPEEPDGKIEEDDGDMEPLDKALVGISKNSITTVDLKMEGLDDDSIANLLTNLLENTSVTRLLLDGNEMEAKSFLQFNELLLKSTNIDFVSLNFVMLGELGSQTISKGLASNQSVTSLSVVGNDLFENGMASLRIGLQHNTKLAILNLSENSISDAGCKSLHDMMCINSSITKLDISNNYINKEGAQHLAQMIKVNKTLKSLNLERNSLEDGGCEVFSAALPENNSLEELFLGNNIIETHGMLALAKALNLNNSLKLVDLQNNIFEIDSEIALQDVMLKKKGKLSILWKAPPGKNEPPVGKGDIQTIIDYFGAATIVDIYKNNLSLQPLVDVELVLTHIRYNQPEAQIIWDLVFQNKCKSYHHPLDILIRIVKNQVADPSPSREFCKLFAQHVDQLSVTLKPVADERLLFSKLQIFQLIKYLVKMDDPQVVSALVKTSFFPYVTDMFFQFTNHSIYLNEFVEMSEHLLTSTSPSTYTLLYNLLLPAGFFERFLVLFTSQSKLPIPQRTGNFGHMVKIANKLNDAATKNKKLEKLLEGITGWDQALHILSVVNSVNIMPADLKPSESMLKAKKPPGEFDDSLV
jgi:Ran GTPase-activating protein (RanGAP) involved in mRNA processing and transport